MYVLRVHLNRLFFFLTSIGPSVVSSQDCLIILIIVHPTVKSETIPVTVIPELIPVFGVIFPESRKKDFTLASLKGLD